MGESWRNHSHDFLHSWWISCKYLSLTPETKLNKLELFSDSLPTGVAHFKQHNKTWILSLKVQTWCVKSILSGAIVSYYIIKTQIRRMCDSCKSYCECLKCACGNPRATSRPSTSFVNEVSVFTGNKSCSTSRWWEGAGEPCPTVTRYPTFVRCVTWQMCSR